MFFSYRVASVWSAPEILQSPKKLPKLTKQMDVYSYGMIIWEIWHQNIPFDGDIVTAQEYVVKDESRPKIVQSKEDLDQDQYEEATDKVDNLAYSNEGQKNLVSIINNTGSESSKGEDDHTFCD